MPVPKSKEKKYGQIVGFNINHGKSAEQAKRIADKALNIPAHKGKKKK